MSTDRPARLGSGLSTLIPDAPAADRASPAGGRAIPVDRLAPGRFQPRRRFGEPALNALARSIREHGVLQPLLVRPAAEDPARYEIVAGERRWLAAQRAGLAEVPAVVSDLDDRAAMEAALAENIQRNALTPIEEAEGYKRLLEEFGCTQERLSTVVGRSRPHIANTLRLLTLPEHVRNLVDDRTLSAGHARALLAAPDPVRLANRVVAEGMSVRRVEHLVSGQQDTRRRRTGAKDADVLALEQELGDSLGLRVSVAQKGDGGSLTLHYRSLDQLDDLLGRLRR
ncbi:MAG: ParB/RepB/Spo0J family partition protein [Alphaproteobacteria bacterium]|nr:ParB/RepB/Spo0J family partition protein [Alphaproteobacteria bacterium]